VRYIFLLAILLALPETVPAQVAIRAGRGKVPPPSTTTAAPDNAEERRAVLKSNGSNGGSNRGSNERSNASSNERQNDRRNDHQNDRRNDRRNDHRNDRANDRPTTGLSPLGLPPLPQQQLPWWEQQQRQGPWWEQQRTPSWERQSQAAWEQQLVNPSRAAIELNRKAREAQRVQRRHTQPTVIYALPPYRYFYPGTTYSYGVESTTYITPTPPNVVAPPPPEVTTGFLRLEVEPRHLLQIFVDGLYVGTPADLGDEFELRLGARRIELRAPGYRTLIFDTQIVPDRTIVYRGALEPMTMVPEAPAPQSPASPQAPATRAPSALQAPQAPSALQAPQAPSAPLAPQAPVSPVRSTIYMIPGCYIGNVAPTADMVRPGCDLTKVITRAPQ
jgi:hypothetical protein